MGGRAGQGGVEVGGAQVETSSIEPLSATLVGAEGSQFGRI